MSTSCPRIWIKGCCCSNKHCAPQTSKYLTIVCSAVTVLSAMARQVRQCRPLYSYSNACLLTHQEEAAPSVGTSVETEDHSNREEEPCSPDTLIHPEAGLKTSDFYKTENIPERFEHPDWFEGYNTKQHNPFYQTSASTHGYIKIFTCFYQMRCL